MKAKATANRIAEIIAKVFRRVWFINAILKVKVRRIRTIINPSDKALPTKLIITSYLFNSFKNLPSDIIKIINILQLKKKIQKFINSDT